MTAMEEDRDQTRSAVENELKSLKERMTAMEENRDQTRSAVENELKSLKERRALNDKDEELKSFKDRVAREVKLSLKTGKTESMDNPVSKTRLKQMYEELRVHWPKIKNHLKSQKQNSKSAEDSIQKAFKGGLNEMEQKTRQIDEVFGLTELSVGTPQKVKECKLSAIQDLQLAYFHTWKQPVPKTEGENPQDMAEHFYAECCWLARLMALNNPPLQPDWGNHSPGMDTWNILPQNTAPVSFNDSDC